MFLTWGYRIQNAVSHQALEFEVWWGMLSICFSSRCFDLGWLPKCLLLSPQSLFQIRKAYFQLSTQSSSLSNFVRNHWWPWLLRCPWSISNLKAYVIQTYLNISSIMSSHCAFVKVGLAFLVQDIFWFSNLEKAAWLHCYLLPWLSQHVLTCSSSKESTYIFQRHSCWTSLMSNACRQINPNYCFSNEIWQGPLPIHSRKSLRWSLWVDLQKLRPGRWATRGRTPIKVVPAVSNRIQGPCHSNCQPAIIS